MAIDASALDDYVIGEERERDARRDAGRCAARAVAGAVPAARAATASALSASDIDLYRTCPLKYKFARVFAIPQEPTINQRFGILIHQVLERFHAEEMRARRAGADRPPPAGSTGCSACSRPAGGARASAPPTTSCSTATARSRRSPATTSATSARSREPVWLERNFAFAIGPHQLRGRVDRVDRLPDGGYEVIDYKTGEPGRAAADRRRSARALPARRPRGVADRGRARQLLVRARRRAGPSPPEPDDAERVERTVLEVAAGIDEPGLRAAPLTRDLLAGATTG